MHLALACNIRRSGKPGNTASNEGNGTRTRAHAKKDRNDKLVLPRQKALKDCPVDPYSTRCFLILAGQLGQLDFYMLFCAVVVEFLPCEAPNLEPLAPRMPKAALSCSSAGKLLADAKRHRDSKHQLR